MSGRPCLKMAMKVLLEVAREAVPDKLCLSPSSSSVASQSASSEEEPVVANQPAAVHALNILRALFRDSRLGEHVVPFISEAVKIAISGFGAALWPVSCGCLEVLVRETQTMTIIWWSNVPAKYTYSTTMIIMLSSTKPA